MNLQPEKLGDPRDYSVKDYVKKVTQRNTAFIEEIKTALDEDKVNEFLTDAIETEEKRPVKIHIASTGSDGRLEKKGDTTSPLEAMVLINGAKKHTRRLIEEFLSNSKLFGQIEVKDLSLENISQYNNLHGQSWPTRIFDAISIENHNSHMVALSKNALSKEIKLPEGKKIQETVSNKLREYRKVCQNNGKAIFKNNTIEHFNAEEGQLFYQPGEAALSSVKYGPLRAIQMFLAYKITQLIRLEKDGNTLIHLFPSTIKGKIDALTDMPESKITIRDGKTLKELYSYFLWCYYLSEHAYSIYGQNITELSDKKLFQENIADTLKLIKLG